MEVDAGAQCESWDVAGVGAWVESLGLPQYRVRAACNTSLRSAPGHDQQLLDAWRTLTLARLRCKQRCHSAKAACAAAATTAATLRRANARMQEHVLSDSLQHAIRSPDDLCRTERVGAWAGALSLSAAGTRMCASGTATERSAPLPVRAGSVRGQLHRRRETRE